MCAPTVMQEVVRSFSRRDVVKLGAAALAAAAASCVACAAGVGEHAHPVPSLVPDAEPSAPDQLQFKTPLSLRVSRIQDLTHTLHAGFPYIPVKGLTFPFKQTVIATLEQHGVFANKWEMMDHIGTHIDATNHFNPLGYDLKEIPLRSAIAPIVVIDIKARAARDYDTAVSIDDLRAWEKRHGAIPRNAAIFMDSGWDAKATDVHAFLNLDASDTMHFPGFSVDAIEFLLRERDVSGIGVDTISFDVGPDKAYLGHKALFKGGKWGIENLKNLAHIPRTGATAFIGATKVAGASGGPVRVMALW